MGKRAFESFREKAVFAFIAVIIVNLKNIINPSPKDILHDIRDIYDKIKFTFSMLYILSPFVISFIVRWMMLGVLVNITKQIEMDMENTEPHVLGC